MWSVGKVAAVLLVTFILSQLLLSWLHAVRAKRIDRKVAQLCEQSPKHECQSNPPESLPVTLITGFLGSGKTCLVNRILAGDHGQRILVIENELGAISIDHELIDEQAQKNAPSGVIVLKNGCMCCTGESPGSELERVLDKLLDFSQGDSASLVFDRIVIETTGMADPSPIIQVLLRSEMNGARFRLDGVVTVVDAKNLMRHISPQGPAGFLRHRPEAEKQIAMADLLLINKVDLVDSAAMVALTCALGQLNAAAKQLRASHAAVPWKYVFEPELDAVGLAQRRQAALSSDGAAHGPRVSCVTLTAADDVPLDALQAWLQRLVQERHEDLYRIKGSLAIAGEARKFVVHGIHADIQGTLGGEWGGEPRSSVLVLIGHKLPAERLEKEFARLSGSGRSND